MFMHLNRRNYARNIERITFPICIDSLKYVLRQNLQGYQNLVLQ